MIPRISLAVSGALVVPGSSECTRGVVHFGIKIGLMVFKLIMRCFRVANCVMEKENNLST